MKRIITLSAIGFIVVTVLGAPLLARRGGSGIDPASRSELEATVVELQAERGATQPTLVVKTDDGHELAIRVSPYRLLDDGGFTAAPGDRVRLVTYQCAECDADAVAGRIENLKTGVSVELRDDEGQPLWRGFRGKCGRGRGGSGRRGQGTGPRSGGGPGAGPGDGTGPRCQRGSL